MRISDVRMRDALLRLSNAGDLFNRSLDIGTGAWKENVALTKEALMRYEDTAQKLKILKNKLDLVAIQIGDILIPIVTDVADHVGELADKFSKLDEDTQKTIVKVAAFAAAMGPALVATGKMVTALSSISKFLRLTSKAAPGCEVIGKTFLGINPVLATTSTILGGILATMLELNRQKDIWDNILGGQRLIDKNLNPADMATRYGTDYAFNSGSTQGVAYARTLQSLNGSVPTPSATTLGRGGSRPGDATIIKELGEQTVNHTGMITVKGDTSKEQVKVISEDILRQLGRQVRR
jgi:hypothetical protein